MLVDRERLKGVKQRWLGRGDSGRQAEPCSTSKATRDLFRANGRLEFREIRERTIKLALEMPDAQQTANSTKQFDLVDRFCQEIIGASLDAAFEVGRLIQRGDHQDEEILGVRIGANFPTDFEIRRGAAS